MNGRSRYFEELAVAVAGGAKLRDAAITAKCAESTAYRVAKLPEFRSRVSELRTAATDSAVGRLSELAVDAVNVLGSVMRDQEAKAADRVTAAKTALSLLAPLSELAELRARLDQLESRQQLGVVG